MSVTRIDLDGFEKANRYLSGRLSEAECADFESEMVRDPQLMRELETIARLKVGLQVLEERGELDEVVRGAHWSYRWIAVAAAVGVLAIALLTFRSFVTPGERSMIAAVPAALTDRQGNVLPSAGTFTVLRKRVTTADALITLPEAGGAIELKVLPESPAPAEGYRVSLWQQTGSADERRLGAVTHVMPASDGFLAIFMDTTALTPGEYLLVVSPTDADDRPDRGDVFRISMSRAPN